MTVTHKSPKQFRFTFTSRLQNLSLDVIEALYRANDTFVTKENASAREKRLEFQHQAMTNLKLLAYFSLLAREQNCILPRQYEQISPVGWNKNLPASESREALIYRVFRDFSVSPAAN
jgi:hypothetical protein